MSINTVVGEHAIDIIIDIDMYFSLNRDKVSNGHYKKKKYKK